jgi:hypothetical protein
MTHTLQMVSLMQHVVALNPYDGKIYELFNGITMKITLNKTLMCFFREPFFQIKEKQIFAPKKKVDLKCPIFFQ